jgi:hypothetical protein
MPTGAVKAIVAGIWLAPAATMHRAINRFTFTKRNATVE